MRILFIGDSPTISTGFGVVSENILAQLHKKGHELIVFGVNHFGDPYDTIKFPYMIYPGDRGSMDAMYGYRKVWFVAKKHEPDLIFFLNDPWVISKYLENKPKDLPKTVKFMAYYPIDAGPLKSEWADMLTKEFDAQVCYSAFAENVIIEANKGKRPKNLHQIYHGVDTSIFKPIQQGFAREKLGLPQDKFIVGMVARNQYRKRFDILMKVFADFAKNKPEAALYLHTGLEDVGFDILDLARQFNLRQDQLILTEGMRVEAGVTKEQLNLIYNSFDVHCLISLGDGFGLPVAESMAVGCAQIVSDHSCLKELVEGHGGLTVKNAAWILNTAGINTWGGVSDESDLLNKLNFMYNNKEKRIKMAEDGFAFINQNKFKWETIGNQFDRVIKDIYHIL